MVVVVVVLCIPAEPYSTSLLSHAPLKMVNMLDTRTVTINPPSVEALEITTHIVLVTVMVLPDFTVSCLQ